MALYLPLSAGAYFFFRSSRINGLNYCFASSTLLLRLVLLSSLLLHAPNLKVQYLNAPSVLGKGGPRLILMLSVFE